MPNHDLCTEEEITALVHRFYGRVRKDPTLGPIFDAAINDWDRHLQIMVDFWSSLLRRSARYSGTPMPKHVALPDLNVDMFRQWLTLFHETTSEFDNRAFAESANDFAQRIARSLWFGYQLNRQPSKMPSELHHG